MPTETITFDTIDEPACQPGESPFDALAARYRDVRAFTEGLCAPLEREDYVVQTMTDVSPTKWHLAHTTWFFETFVLNAFVSDYRPFHPQYAYLFNSYYVQAGERHCRDRRGYLSRPTVEEVYRYRAYVDDQMESLFARGGYDQEAFVRVMETGLNHEQQHQELMLTDIKHVFSVNPLRPPLRPADRLDDGQSLPLRWVSIEGGLVEIGHDGDGFAYDNEGPRHRHYLDPFQLANRPVTNAEYLAFMEDGGYARPELWLSEGWATAEANGWSEPFYWEQRDGRWYTYTLAGMLPVVRDEPVCHLSYFEADAYARWAGARLPTEQEWEHAAHFASTDGNFVERARYHPLRTIDRGGNLHDMYGNLWEWTRSQYSPYPGYSPPEGALGEYNGKFMCNQFVLRGGSCATSKTHIRRTYRNFFAPPSTWQFSGVRLARDGR